MPFEFAIGTSTHENGNIPDTGRAIVHEAILSVRPETRLVLLNLVGLMTLVAFTGMVYLRTQEPLILLVGGLIAIVSLVGTMMRKT